MAQSADGVVYLRTQPGALIWRYRVGEEEKDWLNRISPAGGTLALAVLRRVERGSGETVEALDTFTGKRIWASGNGAELYAQTDDGALFLTKTLERFDQGNVEAGDAATGRAAWTSDEAVGVSDILVTDDLMIVKSGSDYLHAFTR